MKSPEQIKAINEHSKSVPSSCRTEWLKLALDDNKTFEIFFSNELPPDGFVVANCSFWMESGFKDVDKAIEFCNKMGFEYIVYPPKPPAVEKDAKLDVGNATSILHESNNQESLKDIRIKQLEEALRAVLGAAWDGPIGADHYARIAAVNVLERKI